MCPATGPSGPWLNVDTLAEYVTSQGFAEFRMCPCYNMMPRELFENMNCRPIPTAVSMSQNYLHCQAVDTTAVYAGVAEERNYTFAAVRVVPHAFPDAACALTFPTAACALPRLT